MMLAPSVDGSLVAWHGDFAEGWKHVREFNQIVDDPSGLLDAILANWR